MALIDFFTPKVGCTNCCVGEGVEERAPQKQEKGKNLCGDYRGIVWIKFINMYKEIKFYNIIYSCLITISNY